MNERPTCDLLFDCEVFLWTLTALAAEPTTWDFAARDALWQPRQRPLPWSGSRPAEPTARTCRACGFTVGSKGTGTTRSPKPCQWPPGNCIACRPGCGSIASGRALLGRISSASSRRPTASVNLAGPIPTPTMRRRWANGNGSAESSAPEGTRSAWLALEKGTNGPTEIDAYLADVLEMAVVLPSHQGGRQAVLRPRPTIARQLYGGRAPFGESNQCGGGLMRDREVWTAASRFTPGPCLDGKVFRFTRIDSRFT